MGLSELPNLVVLRCRVMKSHRAEKCKSARLLTESASTDRTGNSQADTIAKRVKSKLKTSYF